MSISYTVTADQDAIKDAVSLFEFVGGNTADALRIAINKAAPKIRTVASRAIRDQVRLSASYVGDRLTVTKATRARLSGAIKTPTRGLLLSRFSTDASISGDKVSWIRPPPVPKSGIRVKIKPSGGTTGAPGLNGNRPFYMRINGGQNIAIAARIGKGRKVKVFSGPSLSQVFNTVRDGIMPQASQEFQAQLIDAMRYVLVKKYPPEALA